MTTLKQLVADREEYLDGQAHTHVVWSRKRSQWWAPNARGYVKHIEHAGRYTEEEARQIERQSAMGPEHLRSVAMAYADAVARRKVPA